MFSRVLVANRGEIAVRVIRALHELGVEAVAVYSTADRDALHVRLAEHAVCIGPPAATDSYLRIPNVVAAAITTGCEAVHPGYGFLAENAAFAAACAENDLVFVGPSPDVMERLGDKASAKAEMRAAGVPLVPGTVGAASLDEIRDEAALVGFPVMLKAIAGGGGKGMRLVDDPQALDDAFAAASAEADAAFGDGSLYLEKVVAPARHVEIQVLCDTHGERPHARRARVLDPAAAPEARRGVAVAGPFAGDPRGAGGIGRAGLRCCGLPRCRHVRVPARARGRAVLHRGQLPAPGGAPVSELVTGIDVVREQVRIAAGEPLKVVGRAPRRGHAIEVRINAEDPSRGFVPAPGVVSRFRAPLGPGVRVDTAIEEGMEIPPYYDSLIAKVIVLDDDRPAAIARTIRALEELVVDGIPTTRDLALDVLRSEGFASGTYSTGYLDEMEAQLPSLRPA